MHANAGPDTEFGAMQTIFALLEPLTPDARLRVINYVASRLQIAGVALNKEVGASSNPPVIELSSDEGTVAQKFETFAELYDAAKPTNNTAKALVAGYWLQVCGNSDSFDGFSANRELKNLGQGVGNITNAIDGLKNQKPSQALQIKKSGKSQQSRKLYKLTVAGINAVKAMLDG